MDTRILKEIIALIRKEQEQRSSLLCAEDHDYINDYWPHFDDRFLNELCLMFMVTLRHKVEREINRLVARAVPNDKEISNQQCQERTKQPRKGKEYWKGIKKRLTPESCDKWDKLDVLPLLANSYKHDLLTKPGCELLEKLQLNPQLPYARLPESREFLKGLAKFSGLDEEKADYCDIAERFVDISNDVIEEIQSWPCSKLIKDISRRVSIKPSKFEG